MRRNKIYLSRDISDNLETYPDSSSLGRSPKNDDTRNAIEEEFGENIKSDNLFGEVNDVFEEDINSIRNDDPSFPIAVRKGFRECRSRPRYPIENYLSYHRLSCN